MSWYKESGSAKDANYEAPKIVQNKLDAGGNYVGASSDLSSSSGTVKPAGNSIID